MLNLFNNVRRQMVIKQTSRFFATPAGDGISDKKNPRVFFKIAKNGAVIGDI